MWAKKSNSKKARLISDAIVFRLSSSSEPHLIEALGSPDSLIRQSAVEFLGKIGSHAAIPPISELLQSERSFEVIYSIPVALASIGGEEIVPLLIQCLKSEVAQARVYAARLLGQMKTEAALDPMLLLLADDDSYVRSAIRDAIVQMENQSIAPLIGILQTDASDFPLPPTALITKDTERNRRNSLRMEVINTLGKIRDDRVISALIPLLNDKDVSASVIAALSSLGSIAVEELIAALQNPDDAIKANSALILGNIGDGRAVNSLIFALGSPVKEVRVNVALALGNLKPKEAIGALNEALKSDESTKLNAIVALGNISAKDDLTTRALIKIAGDKFERDAVRVEAITALSKIKDDKAIKPMIDLSLNDDDPDSVRKAAAYFLGEIKSSEAVEPMLSLLESLMDDVEDFQRHIKSKYRDIEMLNAAWKSSYVKWTDIKPAPSLLRSEAAISLGKVKKDTKDEKTIDRLVEVLKEDKRASVRKSAAWALGEIKGDKVVDPLIKALKDDKRGNVRNEAAVALEKVKGSKVVEPLIDALLNDEYETTRKNAAIALREIKDKRAVEPLIKVLKGEHKKSEEKESETVISAVMSCFDNDKIAKPAIGPMIELLSHQNPIVRSQAATALGNIQNIAASEALINILSDPSPVVRGAATVALGKVKDKKALNHQKGLINLLKSEKEYSKIRENAVEALGEMKDESAVEVLIGSLNDPSENVKIKAAAALGKIKDKRAVPKLIQILEHKLEFKSVKDAAIEALGNIEDPKAAPAVLKFVNDSDDGTASKAMISLGKMKYSEAVMPLVKVLEDRSMTDVRRASAAIALREVGDKRASGPTLKRVIDKTEYGSAWREIALSAGEFQLAEATPALAQKAQDTSNSDLIRYTSALALGKTQTSIGFETLKALLNDGVEIVRAYATSGLGETKQKEALDILIGIMENKGKSEVERVHAARGLGSLADLKAVPSLIKAASESDKDPVKIEAIRSLGKLGEDQAVGALIKILSDDSLAKKFHRRASEALGEAKSQSAIPALESALKHQDAEIHFQSARALYNITGNGYGYQF